MKKIILISIGILVSCLYVKAQNKLNINVENSFFKESGKNMEALSFSCPVCNKDIMIDEWKAFIKKYNGKAKGGIFKKVSGVDIHFSPSGDSWNGYFGYTTNQDNTLTVYTAFQNMQGDFINSPEVSSEEVKAATNAVKKFAFDILKSCNLNDLKEAKTYSNSLSKEKISNTKSIMKLEKNIKSDTRKIEVTTNRKKPTAKEEKKDEKKVKSLKNDIVDYKAKIYSLKKRNTDIDNELQAQILVIEKFENRKKELDNSIIVN